MMSLEQFQDGSYGGKFVAKAGPVTIEFGGI